MRLQRSRTLIGFALSFLAGYCSYRAHLPLAWLLPPLLCAAILSIAGFEIDPHQALQRVGQMTIGASVGLSMTAPVLASLVGWVPVIVLTVMGAVILSGVTSVLLARAARIDQITAFLACLPGGLTEMGNIGKGMGADPQPIAIVQTLRVVLIVTVVPPALILIGLGGTPPTSTAVSLPYALVPVLYAGGTALALALGLTRLNNPWTIGAVMFAAILSSIGFAKGSMPAPVLFAGQLFLGFSVGSRFRRSILLLLPRVTAFGILSIIGLGALLLVYAFVLSSLTRLEVTVAILSTAPGGMSEMVAAAQLLHVAVPIVVAFQVLRGVLVNGFAELYYKLLNRVGLFDGLHKVLGATKPTSPDPK